MDCSTLLQKIQSSENANYTDNTTTEIWLDLDKTSVFDVEYSITFWYGLLITIIISLISSYILSYHYYPYFDKQQKLIKLKVLNIEPYQRDKILPYLEHNTEYNKDVEGIIFDYANVGNISMNTILDSSIELRSPFHDLCYFMLVSTLLSASYLQFYWVISHWKDSYRSYVETECYYFYYDNADDDFNNANYPSYTHFDFQVNINKLCPEYDEMDEYVFDVENFYDAYYDEDLDNLNVTGTIDYGDMGPCYVHKDNFTVRASTGKSGCDCDGCTRCGKVCQPDDWCFCDCCCCQNGCGYCVCIITALTTFLSCLWCIGAKVHSDTNREYKIEQKAMTAPAKDKEYLLTVRESSGEIN